MWLRKNALLVIFETAYETVLQNYNTLCLSNPNNRPPQDPTNPTDPQVRVVVGDALLRKEFKILSGN